MTQSNNEVNENYCRQKLYENFGDGTWKENRLTWEVKGSKISICSGCGFVNAETKNGEIYLVRFWSNNFEEELNSLIQKI